MNNFASQSIKIVSNYSYKNIIIKVKEILK